MEENMCPVDVISLCSAGGELRPLRLRLENGEHQLLRMDIEEILSVRQIPYVGAEAYLFRCRVSHEGFRWLVELRYSIRTHSWCLMKRIC